MALADVPLSTFLNEPVIPYESDEMTRLIIDTHDAAAFAPIAHLTVGAFRDWLLAASTTSGDTLASCAGPDAGDGGGRQQAHAQPGPDLRRA